MLDNDLAVLYQVETKNLNKAIKRNINRFPEEFCFQLSKEEYTNLKFQIGTSSSEKVENEHDYTSEFHYRFLIMDESLAYHIVASLKDAGKKSFAINKIEDKMIVQDLLNRLTDGNDKTTET